MDFRKAPELMAEQKANNKKDKYIEITECLKNAFLTLSTEVEKDEFARILSDTLDFMDPQIYEHYRALVDMYRALTRRNEEPKRRPSETSYSFEYDYSLHSSCITNERYTPEVSAAEAALINSEGIRLHFITGRAATFELVGAGRHFTDVKYTLSLNGASAGETDRVIFSLFDLEPDCSYVLTATPEDSAITPVPEAQSITPVPVSISFRTPHEFVTINVKDLGAKGDGLQDDTSFIQAAIMACPKESRVLIPEGNYAITSIFLKSDVNIELAEGARLCAITDRSKFVRFPGCIESTDNSTEYHTGTWEGNPLPMFAGIICGMNASNVNLYGRGVIDGCAAKDNWWHDPKVMNIAYRPRLFFINHCDHVNVMGITFTNSPSWTLHPFFSDNLGFYDITEDNPFDSPNTDGCDPESCRNVQIIGVRFSLGDDCIAIKAGKIYMGAKYSRSSENFEIRHCLMENGHGAVTIGSEMAGGVKNILVEDCVFNRTDRGLRIKTRRGRGKDAIIDGITFSRISMDNVMTPFVINCFYFCDPDGKTEYVQSRELYPVDDRTPYIGTLVFKDIDAKNCHVAAAHYDGLPEQKINEVIMENCSISFADECTPGVPAMSEGVSECTKKGIFARNINNLILKNTCISGQEGEELTAINVDRITE